MVTIDPIVHQEPESGRFLLKNTSPPSVQLFVIEPRHFKVRFNSRIVTLAKSDLCPVCDQVECAIARRWYHVLLLRSMEDWLSHCANPYIVVVVDIDPLHTHRNKTKHRNTTQHDT